MVRSSAVCGMLLGVVFVGVISARGEAQQVGLNFGAEERQMASEDVAGAIVRAANWNNISGTDGTNSAVVNSAGAPSGLTVTWSGFDGSYFSRPGGIATNGDEYMMWGYTDNRSFDINGTATVKVSGVTGVYDVYVYFGSDWNDRRGTIGIEGKTAYPFTATIRDGSFPATYKAAVVGTGTNYPAANYAVWSELKEPAFTVVLTSVDYAAGLTGMQIVQKTGAAGTAMTSGEETKAK